MSISPKWWRKVFFGAVLFLMVFNPPIVRRISFTMIFSALAVLDLVLHYGEAREMIRGLRKPFLILGAAFAYSFVIAALRGVTDPVNGEAAIRNFFDSCVSFVCQMSISLSMIRIANRWRFTAKDLTESFLWAALAQGCLAAACYVLPPVKSLLNDLMFRNTSSREFAIIIQANSYRRNFGFASTLFDIFGFTMSVLSVMAFCKAYCSRNKLWYIVFAAAALASFLNARTAMVLIAVGVGLCVVFANIRRLNGMDLLKKGVIAAAIIFAGVFVLRKVLGGTSETASWLQDGIGQIAALFRGERTGIFETMSESFIFFPDSILEILFGTGLTPMQAVDRSTDMGYVMSIWRYGIIGSILNYGFWGSLIVHAWRRCRDTEDRMTVLCLAVQLFIYQVKLNTWGYSMAGAVIYPVLMSIALGLGAETEERSLNEREEAAACHGEHLHVPAF